MSAPDTQRCRTCGKSFPTRQLDVTADGYRCFTCGQAAAVRQFQVDREAEIASHNKTVLVFNGFRFWRLKFPCGQCEEDLPTSPGILSFAGPPPWVTCDECGATFPTDFTFRARWMFGLFMKVSFPLLLLAQIGRFRATGDVWVPIGLASVGALFLSAVLALPAAALTGKRRDGL